MAILPKFVAELIEAVTLRAYDTVRTMRGGSSVLPRFPPDILDSVLSGVIAVTKRTLRPDLERIVMFALLFRIQADQARRLEATDATLGVFLTASLVAGPLAFDKAPTRMDRWIVFAGFTVVILIVAGALFALSGRAIKAEVALHSLVICEAAKAATTRRCARN